MLAHAQIVVRAPDGDLLGLAVAMVAGEGEIADFALEIGEDAIAALGLQAADRFSEMALVIHASSTPNAPRPRRRPAPRRRIMAPSPPARGAALAGDLALAGRAAEGSPPPAGGCAASSQRGALLRGAGGCNQALAADHVPGIVQRTAEAPNKSSISVSVMISGGQTATGRR